MNPVNISEIPYILSRGWAIGGQVEPLGYGLINDTYLVSNQKEYSSNYVLQRINNFVFEDPILVMGNITRVVAHVRKKERSLVPRLIPTEDEKTWYLDDQGECWRLWEYINDGFAVQGLKNGKDAKLAGATFSRFQNILGDLPGPKLKDPISNFMRLPYYLAELEAITSGHGVYDKASTTLLEQINFHRSLAFEFQTLNGYIHGDCKVNNLLSRPTGAWCIVDLDTVGMGNLAWDFGDLVRSGAQLNDLFSLDLYEAISSGFLSETNYATDLDSLVYGPGYVTLMLTVRFLADHLIGNTYFKVSKSGDNLERAAAQFTLFQQMESSQSDMESIIRALI